MVDQAEKLRLMVRTRSHARVIAVASGKGGVGKSNVAANLALCLRACRKDVILIDADLGMANLDLLLGMKPRYTLAHVLGGRRSLDQVIQDGPAGIRFIAGASGLTDLSDLEEFRRRQLLQQFTALQHQTDVMIIDTGAGISRNVLSFCHAADQTLVVTTPEPTSMTDAYALIKCLTKEASGNRISLLVNLAQSRNEAKAIFQRISHVARQFLSADVFDAGYILRDEHVTEAVCRREPVVLAYPRCQASLCLMSIAAKWTRTADQLPSENGFFQKVVNWFF